MPSYAIISINYIRYQRFKTLTRKYLRQIALHNKKIKTTTPNDILNYNTSTSSASGSSDTRRFGSCHSETEGASLCDYNLYVNECKLLQEKYNRQKELLSDQYTHQISNLKKQNVLNAALDDCFKRIKLSYDYGLDNMEYTFENKEIKELLAPIIKDCGFLVTNSNNDSSILIDW